MLIRWTTCAALESWAGLGGCRGGRSVPGAQHARQRGQRDHSRPRSPARPPRRLCDAGSSRRDEGTRGFGVVKASRRLDIPDQAAGCVPGRTRCSPFAARVARCSGILGFSCAFPGTVSRSCRLGIRAPCPVDLPARRSCTPRTKARVPIPATRAHQDHSRGGVLELLLGQLAHVRWRCHLVHLE